jgi:flagellar biosynthetic protein FliS
MYPNNQRGRFTEEGLTTASGPRIVVMCFDRLDRDLGEAVIALEADDVGRSHELLCHAQDIVHELLCMIDPTVWEHAGSLAAIYRYVFELLTRANISKTVAAALEARNLLAQLGDAFRQASIGLVASPEPATRPEQFSVRA